MNKARRVALDKIIPLITEARDLLEPLRDDEREAADTIPDSMEEKKSVAENAASCLEMAVDSLDEALNSIEEALNA